MWKFVHIFSPTHQRNIDIESTSIGRGMSVGLMRQISNQTVLIHFASQSLLTSFAPYVWRRAPFGQVCHTIVPQYNLFQAIDILHVFSLANLTCDLVVLVPLSLWSYSGSSTWDHLFHLTFWSLWKSALLLCYPNETIRIVSLFLISSAALPLIPAETFHSSLNMHQEHPSVVLEIPYSL